LLTDCEKGLVNDVKRLLEDASLVVHSSSKGGKRLSLEQRISNAITAGFFMNAAVRCANESIYKSLPLGAEEGDVRMVYIHPNSVFVYTKPPEYVVYQDLVHSAKLYMSQVVKADWKCLQAHQAAWRYVHPYQLTGRPLAAEDDPQKAQVGEGSEEIHAGVKRPREEDGEPVDSLAAKQQPADSKSNLIEQARLRFLARKQR
jgi:hypothetical protein